MQPEHPPNELSVNISEVPPNERPFVPQKQEQDHSLKQHVSTGEAGSCSEQRRQKNRKLNKRKQGQATCTRLSAADRSPEGQRAASVPRTAQGQQRSAGGRDTATGLSANSRQSLRGAGGEGRWGGGQGGLCADPGREATLGGAQTER